MYTPPDEFATPPGERLIRLPATLARVGLGRTAWLDLVRRREAPQPVHIGRAALWVEGELTTWIEARIRAAREGKQLDKA